MSNWNDWTETAQLRSNIQQLLKRPNGRKICHYLLRETSALLDYKANRGGSWKRTGAWREMFGER